MNPIDKIGPPFFFYLSMKWNEIKFKVMSNGLAYLRVGHEKEDHQAAREP